MPEASQGEANADIDGLPPIRFMPVYKGGVGKAGDLLNWKEKHGVTGEERSFLR